MSRVPKDYRSQLRPIWCPGCGDFGVLAAIYQAMSQCDLNPAETVIVSGIGCSSRIPGFVNVYGFHGVHGRALPIATGLKTSNPKLNVVVAGGDGDGYSIGAGHLPHAARRNVNLTYVVMNNETYGLTKGQASPTSPHEFTAKTTRLHPVEDPLNPLAEMIAFDVSFVARGFSYTKNDLADLIAQGIQHKGFAVIDVFSPCPTFNNFSTDAFFKSRVQPLPKSHDVTDREAAFHYALDQEHLYTGIFYKVEKPTLDERLDQHKTQFLENHATLDALFEEFR